MDKTLLHSLKQSLARSVSVDRKAWARQIVDDDVPLISLLSLLHGEEKTAQRFMWLIGDVCELDPARVETCIEVLFDQRDQMPFPGMQRSVSKWLGLTNVPTVVERAAVDQMFAWLKSDQACIASKSYSAKALFQLVEQNRIQPARLKNALKGQAQHSNRAYACRMQKLLDRL